LSFQIEDICKGLGVTALVLNKKLKTLMGITANAFVRSIRMKRAAELLKTGRYSVSEVTYDVGFNDLKYFRECFKKEFGVLPQQYKEQNTQTDLDS
jgi:AraC-like DNA-binding protein